MQITVSITSEEQKPHTHIDNLLLSKNIWFVGLCFILETEQLFLYSMLPNKVDHKTVKLHTKYTRNELARLVMGTILLVIQSNRVACVTSNML